MKDKGNKTFNYILIVLIVIILFTAVASYFYYKSDNAVGPNLITAFVGVVLSALVTLVLLNGQTKDEEKKERNTKVFEEKLRIYQDFLHCLYDVIKDGEVTEEEAIRLQFQTAFITMHTDSEHIKVIAQRVQGIVSDLKNKEGNPNMTTNSAENKANSNAHLMQCLFSIVEEFQKELYQFKLEDKDRNNISEAVKAFSSIMDAVEVKEDALRTEVVSDEDANNLSKKLKDLVEKLHARLEKEFSNWDFKCDVNEGVYVNSAYKGLEESVRVILSYEESTERKGEHYFQVHLEHDDSHEVYKHMKWQFGGRQNTWCWWKYLDEEFRTLVNAEEIQTRDWDKTLTYCETKLTELLKYVETFVKVRGEIYNQVPKDKADVWMYYNTYVAFDYEKTLHERLFIDVFLNENSYSIQIGNRDGDVEKLLFRLKQMEFTVTEQDLKDKRFRAYDKLTAKQAVNMVKELNDKLKNKS